MPLLGRKPLEKFPLPEGLRDNDEVFYVEETKEIFKDYEDYFKRKMQLNSTVWSCSLTARRNLTFSEALQSEKQARKLLKSFSEHLKTPIILLITLTKRTNFSDLMDDVFSFLSVRYLKGETVMASNPNSNLLRKRFHASIVQSVIAPTNNSAAPVDPSNITYEVKLQQKDETWNLKGPEIRRPKEILTKDRLKLFFGMCVETNPNGQLVVKENFIEEYLKAKNVKHFNDIFIGKVPVFPTSKLLEKKQQNGSIPVATLKGSKKQTSIANYFDKNNRKTDNPEVRLEKERKRQEGLKKAFELERQRKQAEEAFNTFAEAKIKNMNLLQDDLYLQDQKVLPVFRPISSLIPLRYFGDALMILEFIYSFSSSLQDKDKFRNGINLSIMERALLCREVAGPLSDIVQVLLGSVFSLQIEETNEYCLEYADFKSLPDKTNLEQAVKRATMTAGWSEKYLSNSLNQLPMDALTVSELLRLHLLMSGAQFNSSSESWLFQHRSGYRVSNDPGLKLRLKFPHILRALEKYTVYQLPLQDILNILKCLIAQIITYSSIKDVIEERLDSTAKARMELRNLIAAERRRENALLNQKKTMRNEVRQKIINTEGTAEEKTELQKKLDEEVETAIKNLDIRAERDKNTFKKASGDIQQKIFAYQLHLGSDRAHRSYWLFESLPGLFIEHEPYESRCLDVPVQNIYEIAHSEPSDRKKCIAKLLREHHNADNKENNTIDSALLDPTAPIVLKTDTSGITQRELLMCTGRSKSEICPVHSSMDPNRTTWSFIYTTEEINALVNSLNLRGHREKHLREQLETEKDLILCHVNECQADKLQINPEMRDKYQKALMQMKEYQNTNLGLEPDADISLVMEQNLVWNLLEFEANIFIGHLGVLKVKNRDAWREALELGPTRQKIEIDTKMVNGAMKNDTEMYDDPGEGLGNTMEITEDDTMDDLISLHDSPELRSKVENYSQALLQISKAIEMKFYKEPFGVNKDYKDKQMHTHLIEKGCQNLKMWSISLMKCRSFSSIFLHYNILYDAVKWSKSSYNACCIFCRKKSEPEKMILCDGCNCGKHLFCFKPKLTSVPEGDWFCDKCKPPEVKPVKKRVKKNREIFKIDSDNEEDRLSSSSDSEFDQSNIVTQSSDREDTEDCIVCWKPGRFLLICAICSSRYHMRCARPPLLTRPTRPWTCRQKCRNEWKAGKNERKAKRAARRKQKKIDYEETRKQKDSEITLIDSDDESQSEDEKSQNKSKLKKSTNAKDTKEQPTKKKTNKIAEVLNDSDSDNEVLANVIRKTQNRAGHVGTATNADHDDDYDSDDVVMKVHKRGGYRPSIISDDDSDLEDFNLDTRKPIKKKRKGSDLNDVEMPKKSSRIENNKIDSNNLSAKQNNLSETNTRAFRTRKSANDSLTDKKDSTPKRLQRTAANDLPLDSVKLVNFIDEIIKHDDAWPFHRPVSKHTYPDYYEIIKDPMDLAIIKSKLNFCKYRTNEEFIHDLQLVFYNCDLYHANTSIVYIAGASLERFVYDRCTQLNLPFKTSDMFSAKPETD